MTKKQNKWIKRRHTFFQRLAKLVLYPSVRFKYGAKIKKCKDKRQRLVLSNHQTAFDQFFIAYGFKAPVYYLASEDLFSNGFISKLLKYAVNPIPIKKQANDVKAVINCIKIAREGGTIAIFPEGNRTFSGTTEYMSPAIVKLVKALKLPVSFFVIRGGYGVQPRWADNVRKGRINAYTSKTIEPNEYSSMSDDELYELIKKELLVDEREITENYKCKRSAECLERVIYVCPYCGVAEFESLKNTVKCKKCGREIEYASDKKLKGVGFEFPFDSVKAWYDYQNEYICGLNVEEYFDKPLYNDTVDLYEIELYKRKNLACEKIKLLGYGNKLVLGEKRLDFEDISTISVLGRNKLNVYYKKDIYQIKGDKRFNAVKYVNLYYRYKNYLGVENDGKFLGL